MLSPPLLLFQLFFRIPPSEGRYFSPPSTPPPSCCHSLPPGIRQTNSNPHQMLFSSITFGKFSSISSRKKTFFSPPPPLPFHHLFLLPLWEFESLLSPPPSSSTLVRPWNTKVGLLPLVLRDEQTCEREKKSEEEEEVATGGKKKGM